MKLAAYLPFKRPPPYPVLREVLVHTRTDRTFRGALWQRTGEYLVLKNAVLLADNPQQLPGETAIPLANVDFIQVVN